MFRKDKIQDIDPEDIFLDSSNLSSFDKDQFQGKVTHKISKTALFSLASLFFLTAIIILIKIADLQIIHGKEYAQKSINNTLNSKIIFTKRGVIYDRFGKELVWNEVMPDAPDESMVMRKYIDSYGFGHLLGFIGYPKKDKLGHWWRDNYVGKSGAELAFNDILSGENGEELVEVDARKNIKVKNIIHPPKYGQNIKLTIDARMQKAMYRALKKGSEAGYVAGSGIIMDVKTGEIIAMSNYPEFDSNVMTLGQDRKKILEYSKSFRKPFINRAISAVYAPGSIVKPYVAAAALAEKVITPQREILSTGALVVPNPYNPKKPSRFLDWKAHGYVNLQRAIAVSSNVYFYAVGGGLLPSSGLGTLKGLGINKLVEYAKKFGFGSKTGIELWGEKTGNLPTPEWKQKVFGENWLLGDTYHSAIGQYGWLVTPIQVVRYISAIANSGYLLNPHILKNKPTKKIPIGIDEDILKIVRGGMRMAVTEGTLKSLNYPDLKLGAKTGTAQVGKHNEYKNSWVVGFWPYENPRFGFVFVLEKAPSSASYGAIQAAQNFFSWLRTYAKEYVNGNYPQEQNKNETLENK